MQSLAHGIERWSLLQTGPAVPSQDLDAPVRKFLIQSRKWGDTPGRDGAKGTFRLNADMSGEGSITRLYVYSSAILIGDYSDLGDTYG
jgi:hypothetical protein